MDQVNQGPWYPMGKRKTDCELKGGENIPEPKVMPLQALSLPQQGQCARCLETPQEGVDTFCTSGSFHM
jgi:hypothetical protein